MSHVKLLLRECREACQWFMEKIEADGGKYLKYVKHMQLLVNEMLILFCTLADGPFSQ